MLELQERGVWPLGGENPLEKEMANSLQYSCLENSMDRGAWGATGHWVAKSRTQLSMHTHGCSMNFNLLWGNCFTVFRKYTVHNHVWFVRNYRMFWVSHLGWCSVDRNCIPVDRNTQNVHIIPNWVHSVEAASQLDQRFWKVLLIYRTWNEWVFK